MNDAMGELAARFRAEALETANQITERIDSLQAATDPAATCEAIRGQAHEIRGAAGIFGFDELKARAAELEETAAAQAAAADGSEAAARLRVVHAELIAALPDE